MRGGGGPRVPSAAAQLPSWAVLGGLPVTPPSGSSGGGSFEPWLGQDGRPWRGGWSEGRAGWFLRRDLPEAGKGLHGAPRSHSPLSRARRAGAAAGPPAHGPLPAAVPVTGTGGRHPPPPKRWGTPAGHAPSAGPAGDCGGPHPAAGREGARRQPGCRGWPWGGGGTGQTTLTQPAKGEPVPLAQHQVEAGVVPPEAPPLPAGQQQPAHLGVHAAALVPHHEGVHGAGGGGERGGRGMRGGERTGRPTLPPAPHRAPPQPRQGPARPPPPPPSPAPHGRGRRRPRPSLPGAGG